MQALILYESTFGGTRTIAEAIDEWQAARADGQVLSCPGRCRPAIHGFTPLPTTFFLLRFGLVVAYLVLVGGRKASGTGGGDSSGGAMRAS
jgi:hypothetical protein